MAGKDPPADAAQLYSPEPSAPKDDFSCEPARFIGREESSDQAYVFCVPVIGQVMEASPERPYLCLFLRLDLGAARRLLIDHDLPVQSRPSSGRGIATGFATLELSDAFSRLLAIADKPKDIPILGPLIQREIIQLNVRWLPRNR